MSAERDSSVALFTYDQLPSDEDSASIRLLELVPGLPTDDIRCNLQTVPLDQAPEYEALSYVWGDAGSTVPIFCGGFSFPVTLNLSGALRGLRQQHEPRLLWVDAICINQLCVEERNHQVNMMRDIYAAAKRTVVWLGEDADDSKVAFALVPELLRARDVLSNLNFDLAVPDLRSTGNLSVDEVERSGVQLLQQKTEARVAFLALIRRPWFSRAWIIQEVAEARETIMICGLSETSFQDLAQAAMVFQSLKLHVGLGPSDGLGLLYDIWDTRRKAHRGYTNSLLDLLLRHRRFQATDPRDKVYALAGISNNAGQRSQRQVYVVSVDKMYEIQIPALGIVSVRPDYRLETIEVYTKLATKILETDAKLDLFSAIHPSLEPAIKNIPSWVPDWSSRDFYRNFRMSAKDVYFDLETQGPINQSIGRKELAYLFKGGPTYYKEDLLVGITEAITWNFLPLFHTTLDSKPDIQFLKDGKKISLSAMIFDIVGEVGAVGPKSGDRPDHLVDTLRAWAKIARVQGDEPNGKEEEQISVQLRGKVKVEKSSGSGPERTSSNEPGYLQSIEQRNPAFCATLTAGYLRLEDAQEQVMKFVNEMSVTASLILAEKTVDLIQRFHEGNLGELEALMTEEVRHELSGLSYEQQKSVRDQLNADLEELKAKGPSTESVKGDMGVLANRRFARSSKGFYTLIPARAQDGDTIALIKGADLPLIIRKVDSGWVLLGEAYVHGIMGGEAFEEEQCQRIIII